ncbi:TetR family transcriptional regulator C-terminal domain-containing protein [Nocardia panacis]|uniref:TetR family transcriptional regulator C-terminal domain-containing protein n=1 Tax=Nocardia panacis TaxID=2340916 RepID=UPI00193AD9E3|nr:TetR family transcriptional regulator C-terminal domain-containing protein [Nocardia panacis]
MEETRRHIIAADPDLDATEALRGFLEATMPLDPQRITSARVLLVLWEHSVANPELARQYRELLVSWRAELVDRIALARERGESAHDPRLGVLADEIISVAIGANVASLMHPVGELIDRYRAYVDDLMRRIAA